MAEKRHFISVKKRYLSSQSESKTCSDCNFTFPSYNELLRHKKGKRKLSCLHCSKRFCSNDHLQKHIRTIKYRGGSITDYESVRNLKVLEWFVWRISTEPLDIKKTNIYSVSMYLFSLKKHCTMSLFIKYKFYLHITIEPIFLQNL